MIKPLFSALVFVFSFSLCADEPGFRPLFNGKNLDGWDSKPGAWEVRDGEIWCTGESVERNWLIWRGGEPSDFVLRLEFRWDKGNSGVQVRSDDLGEWQMFGYQVEIARREVMGLWHHSLIAKDHPKREARFLMTTAGERAVIAKDGTRVNTKLEDAPRYKPTMMSMPGTPWKLSLAEIRSFR